MITPASMLCSPAIPANNNAAEGLPQAVLILSKDTSCDVLSIIICCKAVSFSLPTFTNSVAHKGCKMFSRFTADVKMIFIRNSLILTKRFSNVTKSSGKPIILLLIISIDSTLSKTISISFFFLSLN